MKSEIDGLETCVEKTIYQTILKTKRIKGYYSWTPRLWNKQSWWIGDQKYEIVNMEYDIAFLDPKKTSSYKTYETNFVLLKKFAL